MVASLRGLIFIFKFDQDHVNSILFGLIEGPISRATIITLIGLLLLFLYSLNALCNYYSAIFIEKCNLNLFRNEYAFDKLNVLSKYKGAENKKIFNRLKKLYRDTLPVTIIDLSRIIYVSVILLMVFIAIGFINISIFFAILLMSFIIFLIMVKNASKDLYYINNNKTLEENVKKMYSHKDDEYNLTKQEISNFFSDDRVETVFKNRSSLRLLSTTNESLYFLTYGVLMLSLILSFLTFDVKTFQLDPIYILVLIFSLRYGLVYSRLFGQSLARILRIRSELKVLNVI